MRAPNKDKEKKVERDLPRISNSVVCEKPRISVNLMTVGKINPKEEFGPGNSRLMFFEQRLRDLIPVSSKCSIEVVSVCGRTCNDEIIAAVQKIIDQFPFHINVTFADGIVQGRRITLANSRAPLSFYWDDDCVFMPDSLSVFDYLFEGLGLYDNVSAIGIRSIEPRQEDGIKAHCKPRPGLEPCCTLPNKQPVQEITAEEMPKFVGPVIPVAIHGMGLLTYTQLFRDVGGFSTFLQNQGEWGAIFAEVWRQKGIPPLYLLSKEIMFDHQHVADSPTRTMKGRFKEALMYMAYLLHRYSPITQEDPLFEIGKERYIKGLAKTYGPDINLSWINEFWLRFTKTIADFELYKIEDVKKLVGYLISDEALLATNRKIISPDIQFEFNLIKEVTDALTFLFENREALKEFDDYKVMYPQIKAFGELKDLDLVSTIWNNSSLRVKPYREMAGF